MHFINLNNVLKMLLNLSGGFTVIRWYKRGIIADRKILQQNANDTNPIGYNNYTSQVDNSIICFHPCYILPSNTELLDSNTYLGKLLNSLKLKVNEVLTIS